MISENPNVAVHRLDPGKAQSQATTNRLLHYVLLIALVLMTRVPLIGTFEGEADTSRFVTGVHLWMSGDRSNPLIFARVISPGYYWIAAHLVNATHIPLQQYTEMLSILSLCATLLMVPSLYELSRYVTGTAGRAFCCAVLFLICPAVWWLGIEPHPEAISISATLASLYMFVRGVVVQTSARWVILSGLALLAALLVRGDVVLMFPAFFGILLFLLPWGARTISAVARAALMLAIVSLTYLIVRALLLGTGLFGQSVRVFHLVLPTASTALKQVEAIVVATGPVLLLFFLMGMLWIFSRQERLASLRWLVLFCTWSIPGFLFYVLYPDNLPRHVAIFTLGLICLGVAGWTIRWGSRKATIATALAIAINFLSIPANSNMAFAMSPNVPASASLLHARQREIRRVAEQVAQQRGASCVVGTYTIPYFMLYLLESTASEQPSAELQGHISSVKSRRLSVTFQEVEPRVRIAMPCSPAYSFEFAPDGTKQRFFGKELYSSPLWSHLLATR